MLVRMLNVLNGLKYRQSNRIRSKNNTALRKTIIVTFHHLYHVRRPPNALKHRLDRIRVAFSLLDQLGNISILTQK